MGQSHFVVCKHPKRQQVNKKNKMKLFPCCILFLLLCILTENTTAVKKIRNKRFTFNINSNILLGLPKAISIIKDVKNLWSILLKEPDLEVGSAFFRSKEQDMINRFITVTSKLSSLEQEIGTIAETTVSGIVQAFPKILKLELNLHDLTLIINQINFAEEQMSMYLIHGYENITSEVTEINSEMEFAKLKKENHSFDVGLIEQVMSKGIKKRGVQTTRWILERFTLLDFATWAAGHSFNSLISLLRRMNNLLTGEEKDLFSLIGDVSRDLTESNDVNHNAMIDIALLREFEKIHKNIKQAEDFINPSDFHLFASDWSYALVDGEITNVNTFYETFLRFQKENLAGMRKPEMAWTDLAETYLQNSDFGVIKSLEKIHRYYTTENESENLFKRVQKETKANVCNLKQSPFQTIYNLYNAISVAELKGNTILQFSYMILRMYNKGNFSVEANLALKAYQKYSREKLETVKKTLSEADRTIYKCDPKQHVERQSYTKLTKLLQGYIENEVNLNPYGGCWQNCQYYKYTEYNGCFKAQFCAHQPQCSGKVIDCRFVDSDMDICTSSNPERRYDWIHYENGKILGNKGVCLKKNLFKVDSWWRYLFWHCSYCLCLCDDSSSQSDRYFNLRDVTSDIEKNKVVTGVKIVKENRIIHLQIQQGVLTPLGVVNRTSLSWKPVDNYTINDDNVENNVDYHTMSWLERAIDMDEVSGPPEHVVTGLRFRKIGSHLNLEVRVTPINFTTGEVLTAQHSYWLGNDNTEASVNNPRTEIILNNPDIPIRHGPHLLNSKPNQFVQFQATSIETDAAQSTVPYLDSQDLTSQGFILSGVGLIHRGKSGSGGFIAPKLISYDFSPHLRFKKTD